MGESPKYDMSKKKTVRSLRQKASINQTTITKINATGM